MAGADLDRLRAWSYRRQGLDRPDRTLLDALHDVVAVYSSNPTAPLSLAARSAQADPAAFTVLEQERTAIRLPAMRESIFLLPTDTAPMIFAATRVPIEKQAKRLQYAELTWDDYGSIKAAVREVASVPMTTSELDDAIPIDGNLMVAVKTLSREGLVLRVGQGLRSDNLRYVSTEAWLGGPLDERDSDDATAWLAEAYIRAFGPIRIGDFAWWAGITKRRAKKAMASVETVEVANGLVMHEDDLDAWNACQPLTGDEVALLSKWDPYTMGYPSDGRARFVRDEHQELAYPKIRATRGDGAPLVLRGGEAVATWGHRFQGDRMSVTVTPFDPADRLEWLPESCFEPSATMLGASDLRLTIE